MRNNKLLLMLGLIVAITTSSIALPNPVQPFLPFYWVRGQVTKPGGEPQSFRTVTIYKAAGGIAKELRAITDAQGSFSLNIYELNYYQNEPIDYSDNEFNIAVYKGVDTFGKNAALMSLDRNAGFVVKNIELAAGEGPIDEGVPAGTVPVQIGKDGNDIIISWDINDQKYRNPQIFILTGDGEGRYSNAYENQIWLTLAQYAAANPGAIDDAADTGLADGRVVHLGQNGGGASEIYYKALEENVNIGNQDGLDKFARAVAVGKVNFSFGPGNNYFNYPFKAADTSVNTVFGPTCRTGGASINFPAGSKVQKHDRATDGFVGSQFDGGARTWNNSFNLLQGKGLVFFNNGDQLVATLVGKVDQGAYSSEMLTGNNYIGLPFPTERNLVQTFGNNPGMNDKLQGHDRGTDGFVGNLYTNAFADPGQRVNPFRGYVYLRSAAALFNWQPQP